MNSLLISSSDAPDGRYFGHCEDDVTSFLNNLPGKYVLFVPYAIKDVDGYAAATRKFFEKAGYAFQSIHDLTNPSQMIDDIDLKAIFIGGGNTFRLLKTLQDLDLLDVIKRKVEQGAGYMGTSAGSNMACPTIMTTNDMPIVKPKDFNALNLVDFQINPHFVPGSLIEGHQGETREQRIKEYHEENDRAVIGLPEASWIRVTDNKIVLRGGPNALIFEKDTPVHEWRIDSELSLHTTV
jgi:dipeptidase E